MPPPEWRRRYRLLRAGSIVHKPPRGRQNRRDSGLTSNNSGDFASEFTSVTLLNELKKLINR